MGCDDVRTELVAALGVGVRCVGDEVTKEQAMGIDVESERFLTERARKTRSSRFVVVSRKLIKRLAPLW